MPGWAQLRKGNDIYKMEKQLALTKISAKYQAKQQRY